MKIHIATVAPEFNHQGQNKSRQKTAKNSVQSISSLKITQGQNVPLKSNSIFSEIQQNKFYKIRAKYLNIIRWAEYFHLQEYLVRFKQTPPQKKKKIKSKIHAFKLPIKYSIYWCLPFTPTGLQVATWLIGLYFSGTSLLLLWMPNPTPSTTGSRWATSPSITRFYSRNRSKPQSTIHQTAQCSISVAYVSFSGFLKMKAKPSISPKLTAKYEVGGL